MLLHLSELTVTAVFFFHTQIINYNYLYAITAWLLVVPQWLCFDWSMGCVPIINTYSDPRILCIVALWTALVESDTM